MKSIQGRLVRILSYTITAVVVFILLTVDIAVDSWIDSQFNRAMKSKARMLMTLVEDNSDGVKLDFSDKFMPEFEGKTEPEYFQFWLNGELYKRSDSLDLFSVKQLPYQDVELDQFVILEHKLPGGQDGRILYTKFVPERGSALNSSHQHAEQTLVVAYATSAEGLNFILWLIDIASIVTVISVIVFIRIFVRKSVSSGLSPLNRLNEQIQRLSLANNSAPVTLDEPIAELLPIKDSLNRFIEENRRLYQREKRLTSDISHELKTPITELINLAEVVLRFPDKNTLADDLAPEVLRISNRLRHIVANVMLLHKYDNVALPQDDSVALAQLLSQLVTNTQHATRFELQLDDSQQVRRTNQFALETILTNLLNNALVHGNDSRPIVIKTTTNVAGKAEISVSNVIDEPLSAVELAQLFEPLWQKDAARTSSENYGLGLAIAMTFANAIDAQLSVTQSHQHIHFRLSL
ncbi:sensor histidine kinase [Idiomarina xiamenensis]|uniref:histidine kinase n=1 Tax=Idiomarina xiamenensis 10-D-4 TaxID=740709 RepID=K2KWP1_9GAMM|nr:ATP-binding protein [Idiomarina xiamenensis]EKE82075.1 integral membrane sensor signal transduction histidine kinase [Idiomarina xiamenensis 10-D-4]